MAKRHFASKPYEAGRPGWNDSNLSRITESCQTMDRVLYSKPSMNLSATSAIVTACLSWYALRACA